MIVLVGFMGAGKTTVGRLLAERLGLSFVDTDHVIEERDGRSIPQIFTEDGEQGFRDAEQAAVADVLRGDEAVVSLGGGACGRAATREVLRAHTVVHLDVSLAQARLRTAGDGNRPMLQRPDLAELHAARRAVFAAIADVEVGTDGREAAAIAGEVLAGLAALPDGERTDGARSLLRRDPGRPEAGVPASDDAPAGALDDSAEDR
ncbi:shikimate kinase [Kineococcus sp. SYSU DK001]|uniref:shikimate kinase n=1 Tax=Kineococcus sp. SYSU DK001 TaxID=3383122 RepID=UPI003D7CD23F